MRRKRRQKQRLDKSASKFPPRNGQIANGRDRSTGQFVSGNRIGNRFGAGNTARLMHGLRSKRPVEARLGPDQLAAFTEEHKQLLADLGGDDQVSVTKRGLARRHSELSVIADTILTNLLQQGVLSTKGRQRAALTAYLNVVDRLNKLAAQLGLERRQKPVDDLQDYINSKGAPL